MTEDEVREILRKEIGWKGASKFAERVGVSKGFLSQVMNGKRLPNDLILAAIGLERKIVPFSACKQSRKPS